MQTLQQLVKNRGGKQQAACSSKGPEGPQWQAHRRQALCKSDSGHRWPQPSREQPQRSGEQPEQPQPSREQPQPSREQPEQPEPSREQPPGNSSTAAQLPRRQHQPGNRYMVEINSVFPDGTFGISGLIVFWVAFCCTNPKVRSLDGVACALVRVGLEPCMLHVAFLSGANCRICKRVLKT